MRNNQVFIKDILAVSLGLGIALVYLWPSLYLPFSLIDDVHFIQKAIDTKADWRNFFTSFPGINEGRFAPVFWAYFIFRFWIAGHNPALHHGIHVSLAIISLILLYILIIKVTKRRLAALLAVIWFVVLSPGWESWYRMSTQEPVQVLFLLFFWLSVIRNRINLWISGILGTLLLWTKETSLILAAVVLLPVLWNFRIRKISLVMSAIAGGTLAIIAYVMRHASWSAGNTGVGYFLPSIVEYFQILKDLYIPQLVIASGFILVLFWRKIENESKVLLWQGLAVSAAVLLSLLFWKYPLLRLLMTFRLGLAIFLGIVSQVVWVNRKYFLAFIIFLAIVIKAGYVNFLEIESFRTHYSAREISNGLLLKHLSGLPYGSQIVFNISQSDIDAAEWIMMMPDYLKTLHGRSDLSFCFIDNCRPNENNVWWANWSMYNKYPEKYFEKVSFETTITARPIRTSLRNLIITPNSARKNTEYRWVLFEMFNPPGKSLGTPI